MHSADSSLLIFRYFWNKKAKFGGFLFKIAICHKDLAKAVSKSRANYTQNWMYQWILWRILHFLSYVSFISINIMPGLPLVSGTDSNTAQKLSLSYHCVTCRDRAWRVTCFHFSSARLKTECSWVAAYRGARLRRLMWLGFVCKSPSVAPCYHKS